MYCCHGLSSSLLCALMLTFVISGLHGFVCGIWGGDLAAQPTHPRPIVILQLQAHQLCEDLPLRASPCLWLVFSGWMGLLLFRVIPGPELVGLVMSDSKPPGLALLAGVGAGVA